MATPLDHWRHLYEGELKEVDQLIVDLTTRSLPVIPQIVQHLLFSGGKRLRPILTILSAKMCGYHGGKRHINMAACVELLHTATLLHDDVVDESDLRRGVKTAHTIWGNASSVLVGDFMLSRSFQLMSRDDSLYVLRLLSDVSVVITEGEVKQLLAKNDIQTELKTYLDIIASKTSQLFAASTQIGASIAEVEKDKEFALRDFGQHLGTAFQLIDDALDYSANQEKLGKEIGDDFREGKVTLPVLLAYAEGNEQERAFWERVIGKPEEQGEGDFNQALSLVGRYDTIGKTVTMAKDYGQKAKDSLQLFASSDEKQALCELMDYAVSRDV